MGSDPSGGEGRSLLGVAQKRYAIELDTRLATWRRGHCFPVAVRGTAAKKTRRAKKDFSQNVTDRMIVT